MSNQLTEIIKTRCTKDFKSNIERYAQMHHTTVSNVLLSAVETAVTYNFPKQPDYNYIYTYHCNIIKNKVLNLINIDPNIPANTKSKIRKELDDYDFCKLFCQYSRLYK